jgi:hypothetical protein
MNVTSKIWICFVIILCTMASVSAQDVSIKLGQENIGINQYFTITIQVQNDRLKQYSEFPDIEGFIKRGTSSSTTTNFINGKMSSTQSLTQNYQASDQGSFLLTPFFITINGTELKSEGIQITVGEAVQRQARQSAFSRDAFEDVFGGTKEPTDFIDIKADAFFALSTDKSEVYVGEGLTATLAFYVANANRADMRFYNLPNQIAEIIKKINPPNSWEENFSIDQIVSEPVTINGKGYDRYKIRQTTYYPLNVTDIIFPSVGLEMIKYKEAKNPSFFGRNRQEDYQTFYSKEKVVKVKDLPPHPMKERVAVGDYRLDEKVSSVNLNTGQSFNYEFDIIGEGNISAIDAPKPIADKKFDFYAPNVKQSVNRGSGKVRGVKVFDFYGIPNEPGEYNLGDYFSWVFFNPRKENYDTLTSQYVVNVNGESRKNLSIASNDLGDFYNKIGDADNELVSISKNSWITIIVNIFIVLIMALTAFFLFKKTAS